MRDSLFSIDSTKMSRSAWDGPQMSGDLDGVSNSSSSRQAAAAGISRSQDDATVSYYFQRPQSENDLQAYGGGKRWAIGDDILVEQAKSVSDLEREFHNISLGSDFSTKKFWEVDDGHVSDGKGAMFSASSPWSPRQSTWSSPTADHTVAQALQLSPGRHRAYQAGNLGSDMVDYVLGDLSSKLRIKHDFSHDPDADSVSKTPVKKNSKTPSPFEPINNNNQSGDSQSELLMNGDDSFSRVMRTESPMAKLTGRDDEHINQPSVIGSTPTKKPPASHVDSFAPILTPSSNIGQLNVSQAYGLSLNSNSLDALPFHDYSPMGPPPSMDSPAANQFTSMSGPPLDLYSPNVQANRFGNMNLSMQQQQQQGTYQHHPQQSTSLHISMPVINHQQQSMPQQPPTPGGQPTQMPFTIINAQPQQQQQYNMQQQQHQTQLGHPQSMAMSNQTNNTGTMASQAQLPQQQHMFNHPAGAASFVINGQDPYTVSMPMTGPVLPTQYVQTPWGLYPASIIPPQALAAQQNQQMNNQQQRPASGQRPPTPGQQMPGAMSTGDGSQQQQQMNPQQMQMAPNFMDMNGYPAIVAFYDHNGQLVTMNNPRGMGGTPIRLVSPAPFMFNPAGPNNNQPQQGFNNTNAINYNNSNVGPHNMNGGVQMSQMHMNVQSAPQQLPNNNAPIISNTNSYNQQSMNMPPQQADFGMPQRQDSFGDPNDKFRVYHNMNMQASPAGPLGLVQPPPPLTPPALGGTTGLGLGLGSGGRLYSTAPGAEGTYRNNMMPPNNNMSSGPMFNNRQQQQQQKEPMNMGRSRLLEEFRSNRIPNLQLKDLTNHVVEFSQDQHGSRFIQQKLERANMMEKQLVFHEILSAAYSLMTDVFGNYVIQKFFEFGLPEHKQTLAQRLTGHVLPLALQMYGCRVIQKALESIPPDMQIGIVKELDGHVLKCVKDQNGNHVVQKCIECVDPVHLQFIIDAFRGQVYSLSTHPYGCRVIQRILEHCLPDQTNAVLSELHDQVDRLVLDQYGNYVIQHVLEHGRMDEKSKIVSHISGKILPLSQHKFASNVVEKCVSYGSRAEKAILIEEVCSVVEGGQSALYIMMKDQYANYVIQKMLDISEPNQRKILVHKIRPHVATLRKYTYGKHIIAKLEKYLMKNGGGDLNSSPLTLQNM